MSFSVMVQDMILEILSRLPPSVVGKFRLLNKDCNKRTYESWFLNLNLRRTNSISGYFVQYIEGGFKVNTSFIHDHERRDVENNGVSIDFLPPGKAKIKACDASHGILLCANETGPSVPDHIVCKPTTRQYQIIPDPKMQTCAVSFGLAVIQSNPFRYKILRLSRLPGILNRSRRTFVCEIFDSDSFMWKRIKNLRLPVPREDGLIFSNPVEATGFLHWLSLDNRVIRFCLKTETWSFFQTPKFGVYPDLVRYEGKLGVIRSGVNGDGEQVHRFWVLKRSFQKAWVKVKDLKNIGIRENKLWTPSSDVVAISRRDRFCSYNIKTEKMNVFQLKTAGLVNYVCFPFCSDYERVDLNERRDGPIKTI